MTSRLVPSAATAQTSAHGGKLDMVETGIDRETMGRLAKALAFIRSPEDAVVVALRQAAESGSDRDIKKARALFLKLKPGERRSALATLGE
jgi:hypothetical protein